MSGPLIKRVYDRTIRRLLPRKIAVFNCVAVRQPRLFDQTDHRPDYEGALVEAVRESVEEGDTVVVVGGGWGVGTVISARKAGETGNVITFEGSAEQVRHVRETVRLNQIDDRTEVRHAVVAGGENVYGEAADAQQVSPADLPPCDVLVLDCEGAEMDILEDYSGDARTVIVETHPMYDAPRDKVEDRLVEAGFAVETIRYEDTPYGELPVLTAHRQR